MSVQGRVPVIILTYMERFKVNAQTIQEFMDKYPEGSAMDYVAWLVRQEWTAEEAETQAKILDSLTEGDLADPNLFEKLNEIQEKRSTLKESLDEAERYSGSLSEWKNEEN